MPSERNRQCWAGMLAGVTTFSPLFRGKPEPAQFPTDDGVSRSVTICVTSRELSVSTGRNVCFVRLI